MVIINDIYTFLNEIAPVRYQMDFDNAGFLVGDGGAVVKKALLALDITDAVIAEAIELRAQLIVSHHPLIFTPLRHATTDDLAGRKVLTMARHGISAICMHTNLDAAEGGVNDVLADLFSIRQRTAFADGCGRVGDIDPITVPELAALAQRKLAALCNAPDTGTAVQVKFADTGKPVRRLAVISGASGSLFAEAIAEGADCLLTGEANHHHALDAKRLGLSLIAAGHYATEFPVTAAVAAALRTALPELEVLVSTENRDPYTYL